MKTYYIPNMSGSAKLQGFFPGKILEIDFSFQEFIDTIGPQYTTEGFSYDIFQTGTDNNDDKNIVGSGIIQNNLDPNRICAILAHLGRNVDSLLNVFDLGEVNNIIIILGYARMGEIPLVFYVEHELKRREKINLHARRLNNWGKDTPMVLVVVMD